MILVDFSHLSSRLLHVSIDQAKKGGTIRAKTEEGKIMVESYKGFYLHLLFTNLAEIKKKFESEYGQIVLCIDSRPYWRRRILSTYKSKRKEKREESDIDYDSFYELVDGVIDTIDNSFPFKIVKAETAEADDVIATLSKEYHSKEKVLVVSEDKDFKQLLRYGVSFYRPIQDRFETLTPKEITHYRAYHNVMGDAGDEVPTESTYIRSSYYFNGFK